MNIPTSKPGFIDALASELAESRTTAERRIDQAKSEHIAKRAEIFAAASGRESDLRKLASVLLDEANKARAFIRS